MKRRPARVLAGVGVALSSVPTALLLAVHAEAEPGFGVFAVTAIVRASSTSGNVGASGGLTPLDSGSASVDAALDNSPTAQVLARPVEPGTTFATVNSQLPVPVDVPQAQASYPGDTPSSSVEPAPGSSASAAVTRTSAKGQAVSTGGSQAGFVLGSTTSSASLVATGSSVMSEADAFASGLDVAGVLVIRGVRGHATLSASASGPHTATATTVVGSVSVAGQLVSVDDTGVHAIGTTQPLGPTLAQLTAAANSTLAAGGISLSLLAPIHTVSTDDAGSHALADSGGLAVTVTTPAGAAPANVVTVTLGRVVLSEVDTPALVTAPVLDVPGPPVVGVPEVPGRPGIPGTPGQVVPGSPVVGGPPAIAPVPVVAPVAKSLVVAGHRVSAAVALAALGGWEALTLGSATFAVIALRRPEDEEDLLCPCPV